MSRKTFSKVASVISTICFVVFLPFTASAFESNVLENSLSSPVGMINLSYEDKDKSISGSFEFDGVRIFIETRRGNPTSRLMRLNDPQAPKYEIDIRLLDEDGTPIFVQTGGDEPIDKQWNSSFEVASERSSEDRVMNTQRAFSAASKMIDTINSVQFETELLPEYLAIKDLQKIIESTLVNEGIEDNNESLVSRAASCTDKHYIEIWKKPTLIIAQHSGTLAKVINKSGSTYRVWSACNHGACPGASGMSKKCSKTFLNRCGFSQAAPNCSTPYGFASKQHVCNDDSYIQYSRIKNNTNPSTTSGTCSDSSLRKNAPDCN